MSRRRSAAPPAPPASPASPPLRLSAASPIPARADQQRRRRRHRRPPSSTPTLRQWREEQQKRAHARFCCSSLRPPLSPLRSGESGMDGAGKALRAAPSADRRRISAWITDASRGDPAAIRRTTQGIAARRSPDEPMRSARVTTESAGRAARRRRRRGGRDQRSAGNGGRTGAKRFRQGRGGAWR
jgi:hypothetical protein